MLQETEIIDLKSAKHLLENPMFLIEISNKVGRPIENIYTLLPDRFQPEAELIQTLPELIQPEPDIIPPKTRINSGFT